MKHDQIFTPDVIVTKMLDDIGYHGTNLEKTILEPSFGDGAFLVEMVRRIVEYAHDERRLHTLLNQIYGFEIDKVMYQKAIMRLNDLLAEYGYTHQWNNLKCDDALNMAARQFDYVVGNPPYIRLHHLDMTTREHISKQYHWANGMTDLYVVFFELGVHHLKPEGEMIFITPNSWMKNASQKKMRHYLQHHGLVHRITNYHCLPVFPNVLTYTAITHLKRGDKWEYIHMNTLTEPAWSRIMTHRDSFDMVISEQDAAFLTTQTGMTLGELCTIQNGVATNLDKAYIQPCCPRGEYLRPVIKASTLCQDNSIIFPYKWTGTEYVPLDENELRSAEPSLYYTLLSHKAELLKRKMEPGVPWFQYARSQGIQNSRHRKFVLKHILHCNQEFAEFVEVGPETIVYSGMYIVVKNPDNIEKVRQVLSSREFCRYLLLMGKDMSGNYKSINTKVVQSFATGLLKETET